MIQTDGLCTNCKRTANYPILLHCAHQLCIQCCESMRTLQVEVSSNRYQIICIQCKQVTRTNDLSKLIQDGNQLKSSGRDKSNESKNNLALNNNKTPQSKQDLHTLIEDSNNNNQDIGGTSTSKRLNTSETKNQLKQKIRQQLIRENSQVNQFSSNSKPAPAGFNTNNPSSTSLTDFNNYPSARSSGQKNKNTRTKSDALSFSSIQKIRSPNKTTINQNIIHSQNNNNNNNANNSNIQSNFNNNYYNSNAYAYPTHHHQNHHQHNPPQINFSTSNLMQPNLNIISPQVSSSIGINVSNSNNHINLPPNTTSSANHLNNPIKQDSLLYYQSDVGTNLMGTVGAISDEQPIMCKEHNDYISLYDHDQQELMCVNCLYLSDKKRRNKITPIQNCVEVIKNENKMFQMQAREQLSMIETAIKTCSSNKYLLEVGLLNLNDIIKQEFEDLITNIKNHQLRVKEDIQRLINSRVEQYEQTITDLNYLQNCMKEYKQFDKVDNSNVTFYIFSIYSMIKQTLVNIDLDFPPLTVNDLNIIDFSNQHHVRSELENFAIITSSIPIRRTSHDRQRSAQKRVQNSYINNSINEGSNARQRFKQNNLTPSPFKNLIKLDDSEIYARKIVSASSKYAQRITERSMTPEMNADKQRNATPGQRVSVLQKSPTSNDILDDRQNAKRNDLFRGKYNDVQ